MSTKTQFKRGQTLYTIDGKAVQYNHTFEDAAYAYDSVIVIHQSSYGDDFHEEESEDWGTTLTAYKLTELYAKPPRNIIDQKIKEGCQALDDLTATHKKSQKDHDLAMRKQACELDEAKRELAKWRETYKHFHILGNLLDGAEMFPLCVDKNVYHHNMDIPIIPNMDKVDYIQLGHVTTKDVNKWGIRSRGDCRDYPSYNLRFFDDADSRTAFIVAGFTGVCEVFMKRPALTLEGKTYNSSLDYGTLLRWTERYDYLEIPHEIEELRTEHLEEERKKERDNLRKKLQGLEGLTV